MVSALYDLQYLQASLDELKTYLLSNHLYWPSGSKPPDNAAPYPPITVGNLLLSKTRLNARMESGRTKSDELQVLRDLETLKQKWLTAWNNKASQEFKSRLGQWKNNLSDLSADQANNPGHYLGAIRDRVLLELLAIELGERANPEISLLTSLDSKLMQMTVETEFLWEEDLKPGFPQDVYWYLYRTTK